VYLQYQAEAGVDAVQLFESVADLVTKDEYTEFARPYQARVFESYGNVTPTILFAKEHRNVEDMISTGADVISIGRCVDLAEVKARFGGRVAVQGNIDNELLRAGSRAKIEAAVRTCIAKGGGRGHILNLNHGVLRDTPFENVRYLINVARSIAAEPTPVTAPAPAQEGLES